MANIAIFRINYKSDFILTLNSDAGWMTHFCIKFWTGAPSQAYFVGFDGTTYTHCAPVDGEPTKLRVQFDDHHLPIGDLKFQIGYHFTIADFPTSVEDEVINQASVIIEQDGEPAQVMLDFTGETAPEIQFALPAYANEAQRIANEQQRIENEQQRIANEETRIQHEESRIAAEQTRQQNEQQRINQEQARVNEYASLKADAVAATGAANDAAALANQKAQLAADKAALAQSAANLANAKAQLASDKAALAASAAQLANDKASLAQQKAEYAQTQGGYAKDQGDYAKDQGDYAKAQGDYAKDQGDYAKAKGDYAKDQGDYAKEQGDYAKDKGDICAADHQTAVADHQTATADNQTAAADHQTAIADHNQAGNDHTRAESDHTRAESDHDAVELYVDSLGVFDLSKHNAVGGVLATYADLDAALTALNALDSKYKYGGMSFKFVRSSDNKYIQARCMAQNFTTDVTQWQVIDSLVEGISLDKIDSVVNTGYLGGSGGNRGKIVNYGNTSYTTTNYLLKAGKKYVLYCDYQGAYSHSNNGVYLVGYGLNTTLPSGNIAVQSFLDMYATEASKSIIEPTVDTYLIINQGYAGRMLSYFKIYEDTGNLINLAESVREIKTAYKLVEVEPIIQSGYLKTNGYITNYGSTSFRTYNYLLKAGKTYLVGIDIEKAYTASNGTYLVGYGLNATLYSANGALSSYVDMYNEDIDKKVITPDSDVYITLNTGYEYKMTPYVHLYEAIDILDFFLLTDNNIEYLQSTLSEYRGKKCLYIGDSISTQDNYKWKGLVESTYKLSYVRDKSGQLAPANGGITVRPKEDESETALSAKTIWYRCAENRMSIYDFDIISLFGGTNDMASDTLPIGTLDDIPYVDDASSFETPASYTDVWTSSLTFAQCLMGCIEMLKRDFPNKEIIICTVMPCGGNYGNWTDPVSNLPASQAIAELQVRIANKYSLKVIPFYWNVRTVANATNNTFSRDGVHPNYPCALRMRAAFAEILCL